MAAGEMPLARASFLKFASHASKLPVLWQFAWLKAASGIANSSAETNSDAAATDCIFIEFFMPPLFLCGISVQIRTNPDRLPCSSNAKSHKLGEAAGPNAWRRRSQRRRIFDNIM